MKHIAHHSVKVSFQYSFKKFWKIHVLYIPICTSITCSSHHVIATSQILEKWRENEIPGQPWWPFDMTIVVGATSLSGKVEEHQSTFATFEASDQEIRLHSSSANCRKLKSSTEKNVFCYYLLK